MLLTIPFDVSGELLKFDAAPRIFKVLSLRQPVTAGIIMREAQASWKTVWTFLRILEKAEYITREGRKYTATDKIKDEFFLLNLHDCLTDELFRWKVTRALLYLLYTRPSCSLRDLSHRLGVSYETVKAILRKLRKIALVHGCEVEKKFLAYPADPTKLVPRAVHRNVVRHFLSTLKTYVPDFDEAVVVYGDASWGKPAFELDIAAVVASPDPDKMLFTAKKLTYAAENVTVSYGAKINLAMMARYVWPQLRMEIVDCDNPSILSVADGICMHGRLPGDDEFFELGQLLRPWPYEEIREKLEKEYIKPVGGGKYTYTEKAIRVFREKRSKVTVTQINVDGKSVSLIGVAPPYGS